MEAEHVEYCSSKAMHTEANGSISTHLNHIEELDAAMSGFCCCKWSFKSRYRDVDEDTHT